MTKAQLLHLIDQLPGCGVHQAELTGGEPLICPHFQAVVKQLSQRHISLTRILTNGLAVDEALFAFLTAQGQKPEIVISFDGLGTHDHLRNHPHAEESALAAMRLTVSHGFPLRCTVQVNQLTLPRLTETCRFLKDIGAGSLYLIRTMETPRWAENTWVDESLAVSDYYDACCILAETMVREHWNLSLDVFNGFSLSFAPTPTLASRSPCNESDSCLHSCGRASRSFFIEHTGHVLPCDAFEGIGQAGGLMEDETLKEKPLAELLCSSSYARITSIPMGEIKNANEACRSCSYFPQCGGGCRAAGFGSSLFHEKGYAVGQGRLQKQAFTTCVYYRGGYDARMRALVKPPKEPQAE